MNGVLGHDSARQAILGSGQPGVIRWNFVMNHASGAGWNPRPVDQQSRALPLLQTPTTALPRSLHTMING